jgi:hypothetical protein
MGGIVVRQYGLGMTATESERAYSRSKTSPKLPRPIRIAQSFPAGGRLPVAEELPAVPIAPRRTLKSRELL